MSGSQLVRHGATDHTAGRGTCQGCRRYEGGPVSLESQLPGIRTLSSAYGAVRAADGLCTVHARYVPAHATCGSFEPLPR